MTPPGRDPHTVPLIDLVCDLNREDDLGRNMARRPAELGRLTVGSVVAAGRRGFWAWGRIEEIDEAEAVVYFRQISATDAARQRGGSE